MELQLEELEATATEDEIAAERATARTTAVARSASRSPSTCHASWWVIEAPTVCTCCGSSRIVKMGEDITETLERDPSTVEGDPDGPGEVRLSDCEKISQSSPAPFHATPRG